MLIDPYDIVLMCAISRCAGVTKGTTVQANLTGDALERAREELAGWTGETDSEAEEA